MKMSSLEAIGEGRMGLECLQSPIPPKLLLFDLSSDWMANLTWKTVFILPNSKFFQFLGCLLKHQAITALPQLSEEKENSYSWVKQLLNEKNFFRKAEEWDVNR